MNELDFATARMPDQQANRTNVGEQFNDKKK
jgi:hypothetical protein